MGKQEHGGGCLCGGVQYRATGAMHSVITCHCGQCRRMTGHYGAFAACPREEMNLVSTGTLAWYESSPGIRRGFCSRCGSSLFWNDEHRKEIYILAGTLDSPTGLRLVDHCYVADKGDYYEIGDGLPQHAQWPPNT